MTVEQHRISHAATVRVIQTLDLLCITLHTVLCILDGLFMICFYLYIKAIKIHQYLSTNIVYFQVTFYIKNKLIDQ